MKKIGTKHFVLLGVILLFLDQITKYAIAASLELYESITIIPNFFYITYVQNTGAAWSMLEGKMGFFYVIGIVFLIAMVYFYRNTPKKEWFTRLGIVLMMSGTVGNLIDRFAFQYVRDFLDFIILGYDFPIFNVADIALCVGVGCILLDVYLESRGVIKNEEI